MVSSSHGSNGMRDALETAPEQQDAGAATTSMLGCRSLGASAMTSDVKSGLPIFLPVLRPLELCPSAEPEPGRHDGCSCCSPWIGSHLPCVRQVPASLSGRGFVAASERYRGLPHTGAASLPMDGGKLVDLAMYELCINCVSNEMWAKSRLSPALPGQWP